MGGNENTYEVYFEKSILDSFNRHLIFKINQDETDAIIQKAVENNEKILVVYNTIKEAQEKFKKIEAQYPDIPKMLIHSRFRRKDRFKLEEELQKTYNNMNTACIVVSTQVVEVSLDISFDRMITQSAPIDSLIQRFGRVNRKRNSDTIGKYKPIYVITPEGNLLPYKAEIIERSFDVLPDNGELLKEVELQNIINSQII